MNTPIILATWSFGTTATDIGWKTLSENKQAIDAVEQACCAIEADPTVNSVGFGGTPDSGGEVSLDGCIMLSPSQCGSVCYIRNYLHPVSIARQVMEKTPHVMLAGQGAERFAHELGFETESLLSEQAKLRYEEAIKNKSQSISDEQKSIGPANREDMTDSGDTGNADNPFNEPPHDTVGVLALDSQGQIAGACSTSGWPMKVPGRVGDSPIIGQGLYVHPKYGGAVATGHGELVMGTCTAFLAVEFMRQGDSPDVAIGKCLARLHESYDLGKEEQVALIALAPDGQWSHGALQTGYRTAVRTDKQNELLEAPVYLTRR